MPPNYKLSLKGVFKSDFLSETWKKRLWRAFRQQKLRDLIDYYDYNRNIKEHARRLCPLILSGNYKPSSPLSLEVGKFDKLVRRLQIPHPDDGLVLQAIAEALLPFIKRIQKAKNAYFSRSHGGKTKDIHTGHISLDYPWFVLWPRYQKHILDFAKAKPFIVTTDVQNFFDSLSHTVIRRALAPIDPKHTLTDLTIYLLEEFCRREFYGPPRHRGLPQLDFDAPGALAHLVLFPVDNFLEKATGGSFVRWMDDIVFAADSQQSARALLRRLERVLLSLDLRIGGAKTEILSQETAEKYLQVDQNRKLDEYRYLIEQGLDSEALYGEIIAEFFTHRTAERSGQWDKIVKRYYNLFADSALMRRGSRANTKLVKRIELASHDDFVEMSDHNFRLTIARFWAKLRPSAPRVKRIMGYIRGMSKYDDVVAFALATVLVRWNISDEIAKHTQRFHGIDDRRPGGFVAQVLLLAKYGSEGQIVTFILSTESYWATNEFLSRQVISLWSLLTPASARSKTVEGRLARKRLKSVNDLFDFFRALREVERFDLGFWGYLSPANMEQPYSLAKTIIASNVLRSDNLIKNDRRRLMSEIKSLVKDTRLRAIALNTARR